MGVGRCFLAGGSRRCVIRRFDFVVLVPPAWRGDMELTGIAAARALHSLLPVLTDEPQHLGQVRIAR